MNRKIAFSALLIVIIALAFASWLVQNQVSTLQSQISKLQAQNSFLQDQINKLQCQIHKLQDQDQQNESYESSLVRIVAVKYMGGFNPVVGCLINSQVNVTVLNNHTYPVSGLTLITKFLESTDKESGVPYSFKIDELQAGESQEIEATVSWSLGTSHTTLIVTLELGDVVMDEWIEAV
jgi:hypothetical protein